MFFRSAEIPWWLCQSKGYPPLRCSKEIKEFKEKVGQSGSPPAASSGGKLLRPSEFCCSTTFDVLYHMDCEELTMASELAWFSVEITLPCVSKTWAFDRVVGCQVRAVARSLRVMHRLHRNRRGSKMEKLRPTRSTRSTQHRPTLLARLRTFQPLLCGVEFALPTVALDDSLSVGWTKAQQRVV